MGKLNAIAAMYRVWGVYAPQIITLNGEVYENIWKVVEIVD